MTISRAQVDKFILNVKTEHRITHLHRPRTTRSSADISHSGVTERSYYSSLFLFSLEVRRKQQSIFSFGRSAWVRKPNCVRNILSPGILDLVIRMFRTSNSITFLGITNDLRSEIFSRISQPGSKKDLRVFSWAKRMNRLSLFLSKFPSKNLPLASETKDNKYTWRAQYNGKLYAVFGKNESFLKKRIDYSSIKLGMMIYFTGEVSGSSPG